MSARMPKVITENVPEDRLITFPWVSWGDSPVLYQTDIGCVTVKDTPFSLAKTPIKAWEYTVAGAAVIGTRTLYGPCLAYGIMDPVETVDEWEDALCYLIARPDARQAQQASMLTHVVMGHGLDTQLHRWPAAYQQIVESAKVAV